MAKFNKAESTGSSAGKILAVVLSAAAVLALLAFMVFCIGNSGASAATAAQVNLMDKYDMYVTNRISEALDGILAVEKVYWLSDEDLVAPEPNQACYGETDESDVTEGGIVFGEPTTGSP